MGRVNSEKKRIITLLLPLCAVCLCVAGRVAEAADVELSAATLGQRYVYLLLSSGAVALLLIAVFYLQIKSNRTRMLNKNTVITLSTIYKSLPDLVLCKDKNSLYTSCNQAFEEFAGCRESELIGKRTADIPGFEERTSKEYKEIDKKVLNEKAVVKVKEWLTYPDGSRRYFETVKTPLIRNGKVVGLLGILKDITELKDKMDEIDRRNNLLKTLNRVSATLLEPDVENFEDILIKAMSMMATAVGADNIYIFKNYEKGGLLYHTQMYVWPENAEPHKNAIGTADIPYDVTIPSWEETLLRGACINGPVRELYPNDETQMYKRGVLSILVVPVFLKGQFWGIIDFHDYRRERVFTKDEELIPRLASRMIANALIRDEITKNLRTSAASLETIVANHPGIIWCVDKAGTMAMLDGMYLKNYGDTGGVMSDHLFSEINASTTKTFEEGAQEVVIKTDNATFHGHTTPIFDDDGGITRVVGGIDDVTKLICLQEELETAVREAQEANKAKSDFLAHMSHEIRTPMNAIIGMVEIALRENDPEAIREHILTVRQASTNLLSIINDILDFSKVASGTLNIVEGVYFFSSLVNDVIGVVKMKAIDSPIRFVVNIDSNIPNVLIGDEIRLRQILINLLGNAVKYTEKGYVSFTINGEVDEDVVDLTLEIMDSGKGIKDEDVNLLFDEYIRVDTEKNKGIEGVGLGLTITRNLVRAMNGSISVYSEYGTGSTFTVKLQQKIYNNEKYAAVRDPEKINVLIYERREIYANSLAFTIDNLGVSCAVVSSNPEFIESISRKTFSFVFISHVLYERNKDAFSKFGADAKVVLLTEFGETINEKGLRILPMPAYSLSVANVLNGDKEDFHLGESSDSSVRFTAPEAKILVVDDINTNLKVTRGLLLPYGMQIDLCNSGAEAIKAVTSKRYDLVFMDHKMPDMDGIEATIRIRALGYEDRYYENVRNVPIVALTANAVSGMRETFLENGFDDFMSKPIDTTKLNIILTKWIPRSKQINAATEAGKPGAIAAPETKPAVSIEGLNVKKGIAFTGGTIELYLETLVTFCEDVRERRDLIAQCLETGDLPTYTTYIHALKSAAANIGGDKLHDMAKALEIAGNQENTAYIQAYNEEFMAELESLLIKITDFLTAYEGMNYEGNESRDVKTFKSSLLKLKEALEEVDVGVINRTLDTLQKTSNTAEDAAFIRKIANKILIAEYDEAAALIESSIKEPGHETC